MKNSEHREEQKEYKIREATSEDAVVIAQIQYDAWMETYPNEEAKITKEDIKKYLGDIVRHEENLLRKTVMK